MKSIILYAAQTQLTSKHYGVWATARNGYREKPQFVYVRAELVGEDALHALDKAKPIDGEIVMNSMQID